MRGIVNKKVEDVMTKDVVTVTRDTTLEELKHLLERYDYNVFLVVEGGEILGVVTKLDFLKIFAYDPERLIPDLKAIFAKNAGDIMSKGIISVTPQESIRDVALLMMNERVRSVLVTDETKQHLKGIISRGDVVKLVKVN